MFSKQQENCNNRKTILSIIEVLLIHELITLIQDMEIHVVETHLYPKIENVSGYVFFKLSKYKRLYFYVVISSLETNYVCLCN